MNKEYREIQFWGNIEEAVKTLQQYEQKGCKAKLEFNGVWLYSDTVTMDSAYLAITGKTKAESDKYLADKHEEYLREEEEHKRKIPALTKEYIERGHALLKQEYWEVWDKCVPIRLSDLYHGWELGCALDIIKILQEESDLEKAKKLFEEQGHSGMSASITASIITWVCDKGKEFAEYLGYKAK